MRPAVCRLLASLSCTLFITTSLIAQKPKTWIPINPGTVEQPPTRPIGDTVANNGMSYGTIAPAIAVASVLIRTPGPVMTLSDSQSNHDAFMQNTNSELRFGFVDQPGSATSGYSDALTLKRSGNLAIGGHAAAHRVSISGGPAWTSNGWKGAMELENGAALAWKNNGGHLSYGIGHTNGGMYFFHTADGPGANTAPAQYDLVIKDDGAVTIKILELDGADVAESFPIDDTLPPGTIVSIDAAHPGKLVMSAGAFDRRVAGVISGAGGINPGVVMGKGIAGGSHPIALSGRVYCLADASAGPINPGDFLTTSSTPGHAMRVTSYAAAQGAIIGKAMTNLQSGRGLVLVLVTLQ